MNFDTLATGESIEKTIVGLKFRGFDAVVVETKIDALLKIKSLIPSGASVMNGSSKTLEEIGYIDYLKSGEHGWNNLHEEIVKEKDEMKQGVLRKQALLSDFYLGSVHGLSETGEMVIASNTGSQLPHTAFSSDNIILVVSTKKIVPTLGDALERLEKYVFPLENERSTKLYGAGTQISKILILKKENPYMGRTFTVILVKEKLGF